MAIAAIHQVDFSNEDMAATVALPMATDPLFRKSTHVFAPYTPL
jgi:hypothetical protein